MTKFVTRVVPILGAFALGYMTRAMEQYNRLVTLHDVGIIERHTDPFRYRILLDDGPYETVFCRDRMPTFEAGEKLQFLTYKNDVTCWNITDHGTGFRYYKSDGKAIKFAEVLNAR